AEQNAPARSKRPAVAGPSGPRALRAARLQLCPRQARPQPAPRGCPCRREAQRTAAGDGLRPRSAGRPRTACRSKGSPRRTRSRVCPYGGERFIEGGLGRRSTGRARRESAACAAQRQRSLNAPTIEQTGQDPRIEGVPGADRVDRIEIAKGIERGELAVATDAKCAAGSELYRDKRARFGELAGRR